MTSGRLLRNCRMPNTWLSVMKIKTNKGLGRLRQTPISFSLNLKVLACSLPFRPEMVGQKNGFAQVQAALPFRPGEMATMPPLLVRRGVTKRCFSLVPGLCAALFACGSQVFVIWRKVTTP